MKITMTKEMQGIDKSSAETYGIDTLILMENAGVEVAREAYRLFEKKRNLCVLVGSGNNGGDALVAARHLNTWGSRVKIFLVGDPEHFTPATKKNFDIAKAMGIEINTLKTEKSVEKLDLVLRRFADGIIDGILGTGFKGELKPFYKNVVDIVNRSQKDVLSIDIPSGVEGDTGKAQTAVKATVTVTFGCPKPGHFLFAGKYMRGKLLVKNIGIPTSLLEDENILQETLDSDFAAKLYIPRQMDVHKGACGKILVVAGSNGMVGAAALASNAALRAGAGLVTLAVPKGLLTVMEAKLTEVMTLPLDDTDHPGTIAGEIALAALLEFAEDMDAVLIGPGLRRSPETMDLVKNLTLKAKCRIILDADGIYAFKGQGELLRKTKEIPVLTPHIGEFATLTGKTIDDVKTDVLAIGRNAAQNFNAIILLKSESTIIFYPDGKAYFLTAGNPGMATAGCGDVLAGMTAGLVKISQEDKFPLLAAYLHAHAADLAYAQRGNSLIASDILGCLSTLPQQKH